MAKKQKKYRTSEDFFNEFMPNYERSIASIRENGNSNNLDSKEGMRVGAIIAGKLKEILPKAL